MQGDQIKITELDVNLDRMEDKDKPNIKQVRKRIHLVRVTAPQGQGSGRACRVLIGLGSFKVYIT